MNYFMYLFLCALFTKYSLVFSSNSIDSSNYDNRFRPRPSSTLPHGPRPKGPFRQMFHIGDFNIDETDRENPGKPLFLSPLIKAGKIEEARNLSRVSLGHRYGHSFSGFLTVNEKFNSNLFFWLFSARVDASNAPVVLWLQGGPGGSSLFGLFTENGPFSVDKNLHLMPRNYSWNVNHHVLYIDNPVGTGFSFTDMDEGYAKNEADVGRDLYNALSQFFQLFPDLQNNDFYVTGESYAGKYVPAIAYTIHKNNAKALVKINLKGMAIGDGLCDPVSMTDYGDFLYQIGLIDLKARAYFKSQAELVKKYIAQKEWRKAFYVFDSLLNGDTIGSHSYFYNVTGLKNYYNFLLQDEPVELSYYGRFVNQAEVRREIHVGNLTFHDGTKVESFLLDDVMKSVKPWIEEILRADTYRVLIYSGQLDIIIASPLTDAFVNALDFPRADQFKAAPRLIWRVGKDVAGYVKEVENFAQVLVRDAGHLVPYDQPEWAFDMISRFTSSKRLL